jgi:hypothetical protein
MPGPLGAFTEREVESFILSPINVFNPTCVLQNDMHKVSYYPSTTNTIMGGVFINEPARAGIITKREVS